MSHLHRLRAAQLAIASDADTCHKCVPVLPGDSQVEHSAHVPGGRALAPAGAAAAAARTTRARKKPAGKKRAKR